MFRLNEDLEPPRPRSAISLRVTILAGIALAMFSIVFFRLWYLQVLSGDRFVKRANDNRIRDVHEQGPRGLVYDKDGNVMVGNRLSMGLRLEPKDLPADPKRRAEELRALGAATGLDPDEIRKTMHEVLAAEPNSPVTLKRSLTQDEIYYLREHQLSFPGVEIQRVFVRSYKDGDLAAHLFGQVGEVTEDQLKEPRYSGLRQGDEVGQSGIEYQYDRYLRGRSGLTRLQVDALGRPKGVPRVEPASPGDNVRLTVDPSVQATGEAALGSFGLPGAFVAMDVHNGDVIAMGSQPSFDPSIFTKSITNAQYKALTSEKNGAPLVNRAIRGAYPTGSVFKPITATAALQDGLLTPTTTVFDGGTLKVDVLELHNANDAVYGPLDMVSALRVSSDIYFFLLGQKAPAKGDGGLIQNWARDFGLGSRTGIDLPNEAPGLIPTPAWRNRLYNKGLTDRPWTVGDNINLSVGQGDLQADPLQMALAYAALGNGGDVVQPHVVDRVEDVSGRVLQEVHPGPRRHLDIADANREAILEGMHQAAMTDGGTSYKVFGNFPVQVAGKTGTAERAPHADQAWYMALAPADNPRVVVAVTIEEGGFGADTAAPVAMRILADYLNVEPSAPVADAITYGKKGTAE
ncbi:MAG: penicillin-binding protein 2 [Solirubrobacterales bacterium]